jgi:hypothetical protein
MRPNDSQTDDSQPQPQAEAPDAFVPSGPLTLANAFRVAAVLCVVAGVYLFFEALQYAPMVGNAACQWPSEVTHQWSLVLTHP